MKNRAGGKSQNKIDQVRGAEMLGAPCPVVAGVSPLNPDHIQEEKMKKMDQGKNESYLDVVSGNNPK